MQLLKDAKHVYFDAMRIKSMCIERYDNGAYSRLQFLRAISHSLGTHTEAFMLWMLTVTTKMTPVTSQQPLPLPPQPSTKNVINNTKCVDTNNGSFEMPRSVIFRSCVFRPCDLVLHFQAR